MARGVQKVFPGGVYLQGKYGDALVLKKEHSGRVTRYLIRFLDTGAERWAQSAQVSGGTCKDTFAPSVCGVGFRGDSKTPKRTREYQAWAGMLRRCYSENSRYFALYGGRGVTVCERWHNFAHFESDIRQLPGYDLWRANEQRTALDKDIGGGLLYSPETCRFLTAAQNSRVANARPVLIDGQFFRSISAAAEHFKRSHGAIIGWLQKHSRRDLCVASVLPSHPKYQALYSGYSSM